MRPSSMKPKEIVDWRKRLRLEKKEAASLLGISLTSLLFYEHGDRADGYDVKIPLSVTWGCVAIEAGLKNPYDKIK